MNNPDFPRKSRAIPFDIQPGSWGLKGKSRAKAEAEYYYEGEALELRMADIDYPDETDRKIAKLEVAKKYERISDENYDRQMAELTLTGDDLKLALIDVDVRYGRLTEYEASKMAIVIDNPEDTPERQIKLLTLDLEHKRISEHSYGKTVANIKEEPWIGIVDQGLDLDQGINGVYFEFDWNEHWITFLHLNGYTGEDDAEMVDRWFADVCRAQGMAAQIDTGPVPFGAGLKS
jgi:hypothetical protein